ncbi:hypothetical protein SAMN05216223_102432 [Actinacidiphila yanglinensis]|uniref:Uncharacterized protein n=1 Tax=Actinacidiphila yanglinensis TaxID=310779 RepID=A0A1H5VUE8_9ACTN|nr:hypothetical protein [Actinacidiphila yanglinensis]SEF90588.1 hypothetical protein SAMN05216223_102432 [Actinacidiphila yanglinensis]
MTVNQAVLPSGGALLGGAPFFRVAAGAGGGRTPVPLLSSDEWRVAARVGRLWDACGAPYREGGWAAASTS